jgi:hypothetical protein
VSEDVSKAKHNLNLARQVKDQQAVEFWRQTTLAGKQTDVQPREAARGAPTPKREGRETEPT